MGPWEDALRGQHTGVARHRPRDQSAPAGRFCFALFTPSPCPAGVASTTTRQPCSRAKLWEKQKRNRIKPWRDICMRDIAGRGEGGRGAKEWEGHLRFGGTAPRILRVRQTGTQVVLEVHNPHIENVAEYRERACSGHTKPFRACQSNPFCEFRDRWTFDQLSPDCRRTIAGSLYSDFAIVRPPIGHKSNDLETHRRDSIGTLRMALCDPSTPFSSTPQEIQWYKSVNLIQREYPFGSHVRCVTPPRVSPGTYVQSCCSQLLVNCLAISVQLWRYERAHVYPPPPHAHAGPRPPPPAPRRTRQHARVGAHGTVGGRPAGPAHGRRPPPAT